MRALLENLRKIYANLPMRRLSPGPRRTGEPAGPAPARCPAQPLPRPQRRTRGRPPSIDCSAPRRLPRRSRSVVFWGTASIRVTRVPTIISPTTACAPRFEPIECSGPFCKTSSTARWSFNNHYRKLSPTPRPRLRRAQRAVVQAISQAPADSGRRLLAYLRDDDEAVVVALCQWAARLGIQDSVDSLARSTPGRKSPRSSPAGSGRTRCPASRIFLICPFRKICARRWRNLLPIGQSRA